MFASFSPSGSDFLLFDVVVVFPSPVVVIVGVVVIVVVRRVLVDGAVVVPLLNVDVVAVGCGSPRSAVLGSGGLFRIRGFRKF